MYFDFILPRLKEAYPDALISVFMVGRRFCCFDGVKAQVKTYEGLQRPGDLIFVPGDAATVACVCSAWKIVKPAPAS